MVIIPYAAEKRKGFFMDNNYNVLDRIRYEFAAQIMVYKKLQDAFTISRNVIDGYNNKQVNKRLIDKLNDEIKETSCRCYLNKRSESLLFIEIRCRDCNSFEYNNHTYYIKYNCFDFRLRTINNKRLVANETSLEIEDTLIKIENSIDKLTYEALHLDELWSEYIRIKNEKDFFLKRISYNLAEYIRF